MLSIIISASAVGFVEAGLCVFDRQKRLVVCYCVVMHVFMSLRDNRFALCVIMFGYVDWFALCMVMFVYVFVLTSQNIYFEETV